MQLPTQPADHPACHIDSQKSMAIAASVVQDAMSQLSNAQEGDRLVKVVHDALSLLEQHGHVYSIQLKPSMVGISPLNRDGSGDHACLALKTHGRRTPRPWIACASLVGCPPPKDPPTSPSRPSRCRAPGPRADHMCFSAGGGVHAWI